MENLPALYKPYKIYLHISPSGGVYVGQTKQKCSKRWRNGSGYKCNRHLQNAISKYGWGNIQHIVLFDNLTKDEADTYEIGLIKAFRKYNCYNITDGGEGLHTIDEYTRKKMGYANKGIRRSPSTEFKKGVKQTRTKELIEKVANANRGKKRTDEQKKRISEGHKNQTNDNLKKKVLQFDLEGNFIKEWECMRDVQRELGIHTGHIAKCCKGILKKTGGYVWKYK